MILKSLIVFAVTFALVGCAATDFKPQTGMTLKQVDSMSAMSVNGNLKKIRDEGPFEVYQSSRGSWDTTAPDSAKQLYYFKDGILVSNQDATNQLKAAQAQASQDKKKADDEKAKNRAEGEKCLARGDVGVCGGIDKWAFMSGKIAANLGVRNNTSSNIKDLTITCNHLAKSGTVIYSEKKTIFDVFEKGKVYEVSIPLSRVDQMEKINCLATSFNRS